MSYDVSIGSFEGNYTWNAAPLFYDHIPPSRDRGGLGELDGLTGRQAVVILSEAFNGIHATKLNVWKEQVVGEPEFCAKYDPPNGWGSTVGALIFLAQIMAACAANPRKKVRIT